MCYEFGWAKMNSRENVQIRLLLKEILDEGCKKMSVRENLYE